MLLLFDQHCRPILIPLLEGGYTNFEDDYIGFISNFNYTEIISWTKILKKFYLIVSCRTAAHLYFLDGQNRKGGKFELALVLNLMRSRISVHRIITNSYAHWRARRNIIVGIMIPEDAY